MIRIPRFAAVCLLASTAFAAFAAPAPVAVRDAWVRAAPPGAHALAGYLVLENSGEVPRSLTGAASPRFESVSIHRTVVHEGVARMQPQAQVLVPPHGQVPFEPGGLHLMLVGPKGAVMPGDRVPAVLHFADGTEKPVEFIVRRGDEADDHHHHH